MAPTDAGKAFIGLSIDPADIAKIEAQTKAIGRGAAASSSKSFEQVGKNLSKAARVGRYALLGLGAGIAVAVHEAANFEQQLNVLQATSGATAAQMDSLSKAALRLGEDAKLPATSAQDAADAMTELSKAGLSVKDTLAAARPVLELSAAAQVDNATAAKITANALNSFHLAGTKAAHVADDLAGAANSSSGDITDMGEAIQYAGSSMHAAGQSIDDTATAIALMSNAGLSGSVAGSSLAGAFRALQAPSKKAGDAIKDLGLNLYDSRGVMLKMPQIISQFTSKMKGLTQQQQNQKLATIFGSRAVQAARIVFLGGADAFDKMKDSVTQAGSAQKLAQAQTEGFNGALQAFVSQIQTLAIEIGLKLLPAATDAARGLSDMVGFLSDNGEAAAVTVGIFATLAATIVTVNAAARAYKATMEAVAAIQAISNPWVALAAGTVVLGGILLATRDDSDAMADAFKRARDASNELRDALHDQHSAHLDVRQASVDSRTAADEYAQATKRVTDLVKDGKKGTEAYGQALRDQNQAEINLERAHLRLTDAQQRQKQATDKAKDSVQKFRDSLRDATDAARKQSTGLQGLSGKTANQAQLAGHAAQVTQTFATKMLAAGDRGREMAAKLQKTNPTLADSARKASRGATAFGLLALQIGKVPDQKTLSFYINTFTTSTGDLTTSGRGRPTPKGTEHGHANVSPTHPPRTATGGAFYSPQVRLIAEAGPEAVVPLKKYDALLSNQTGSGAAPTVINHISIDGRVLDEVVDYRVDTQFEQLGQYVATRPGR